MPYRYLSLRRDGPIEYLTLNRPDVRNAFNADMIAELGSWAATARADEGLRAVVLAGAGPAFCAGADAAWMAETVEYSHDQNVADATAAAAMFAAINALPMAVIGRVHGAALGGGVGLAAVCDIAVADDECVFGFTEVKLGIIPAVISPFVLAKVGPSAARELFLTGARFSAARAHTIGLVHGVVPMSELDKTVAEYVREILTGAPAAVRAAKALIRDVLGRPLDEAMPSAARAIAAQRVSPQGQEGLRAFLEKRKPSWAS
jgi:methylglutaconyl-CoA hydratase